jgi:hypothetical protein
VAGQFIFNQAESWLRGCAGILHEEGSYGQLNIELGACRAAQLESWTRSRVWSL